MCSNVPSVLMMASDTGARANTAPNNSPWESCGPPASDITHRIRARPLGTTRPVGSGRRTENGCHVGVEPGQHGVDGGLTQRPLGRAIGATRQLPETTGLGNGGRLTVGLGHHLIDVAGRLRPPRIEDLG